MQFVKWIWPNGHHSQHTVGVVGFDADTQHHYVTGPQGARFIVPRDCTIFVQEIRESEPRPTELAKDEPGHGID